MKHNPPNINPCKMCGEYYKRSELNRKGVCPRCEAYAKNRKDGYNARDN